MTVSRAIRFALLLTVSWTISTAPACAATDHALARTPIHRTTSEPATSADLHSTGTGGTTLVFVGVLLAAAILARRVVQQRRRHRTAAAPEAVRLLSRQQLDNELTVRVVQVGPRLLVVGSTPQGLSTLAELTDPQEISLLTGDAESAGELFDGRQPLGGPSIGPASSPSQRRTSRMATPTPTGG